MKVAVVILNWNGRSFLEDFLPGVIEHSSGDAEIIIADNNSTDDSVDYLQSKFPDIRVIQNKENGGFAKGYNDALKLVEAEYYILLNSDIEVTAGWIQPIIKLMDSDKSIAACQPKILAYNDKSKFEYAGAAGGFIDKYGYPFCKGRLFQSLENDNGQYDEISEIFWASGACFFVRAELFHKFDGLDEDFFAHMEEIDFCWRLKQQGYKIMVCPQSKVYHIGGGTLPKKSSRKTHLNIRNNLIMLYKNLPSDRLFIVFFARFFLDGVAAIKFLLSSGYKDFFAVTRAHIHFYISIPRHRKKRIAIQPKKVINIYNGNIVYDYYLKGKKTFSSLKKDKF
ncbi:MAG: glycosyltransferase family 2 protein [Bacteroidales bacterium]|nr:glycosyltransferase family 2 protein [Bacteroidales bacterium]